MVMNKVEEFSQKTSKPKRVSEAVQRYLGIQGYQQSLVGKMWLMGQFLLLNIFPHEVQILARKIVYNYKCRNEDLRNSKIRTECRKVVNTRL